MSTITTENTEAESPETVTVSDSAYRILAQSMRTWSGWHDATLVMGKPVVSPFAETDHNKRQFTFDPEPLVLNPHRVVLTMTPFRMRQEAVLTGALLHEAGHARYSHWAPRTAEQAEAWRHSDGSRVSAATANLARLMEEPRIEGLVFRNEQTIGAPGLSWTMRASAAHLLPISTETFDPSRMIMDVITSWALRAGREIARCHGRGTIPNWVYDFNVVLDAALVAHLTQTEPDVYERARCVNDVRQTLIKMVMCTDNTGPTMIDLARDVLAILFPETDDEDMPSPGVGCAHDAQPEQDDEQDDSEGEGGQGSGDQQEDGEQDAAAAALAEAMKAVAEQLARAEAAADTQAAESDDQSKVTVPSGATQSGGTGSGSWREPTSGEREVQRNAERFLRDLVNPTESSRVYVTDSPSSAVDGAALAAWRAAGATKDPRFFRRTVRTVTPAPPVQIAVLVDVSGSMEDLQEPSALLSWALSSAAVDLRNFAGRGTQVASCLVHWGSTARVVQRNGELLPGIREVPCDEGTWAMAEAMQLVQDEMPTFFDEHTTANRLLVQFTDWELGYSTRDASSAWVSRALAAGVNMLTIAPRSYRETRSSLPDILRNAPIKAGRTPLVRYNPGHPDEVWTEAARALR